MGLISKLLRWARSRNHAATHAIATANSVVSISAIAMASSSSIGRPFVLTAGSELTFVMQKPRHYRVRLCKNRFSATPRPRRTTAHTVCIRPHRVPAYSPPVFAAAHFRNYTTFGSSGHRARHWSFKLRRHLPRPWTASSMSAAVWPARHLDHLSPRAWSLKIKEGIVIVLSGETSGSQSSPELAWPICRHLA